MRRIERPTIDALSSFDLCVNSISDLELKNRMASVRDVIAATEAEFVAAAERVSLHLLRNLMPIGNDLDAELESNYTSRFVKLKRQRSQLYGPLLLAAPNGICPYCGHRDVSTLDHYLPKDLYPALAVAPINLIPSCAKCNHKKGTAIPTCEADHLFNAYFDDFESVPWLSAEIVEGAPAGARFFLNDQVNLDDLSRERVRLHFEKFELASLFAGQAGWHLQNVRRALLVVFEAGGVEAVREEVARYSRSYSENRVNSWQAALLAACLASDWYCNGGFMA